MAAGYPQVTATAITWAGTIGNFTVQPVTGTIDGTSQAPFIDLGAAGVTTATGGTIWIAFSQTGLYGLSAAIISSDASDFSSGSGSVTYTGYVDTSDNPLALTTNVVTTGAITANPVGSGPEVTGAVVKAEPYSMTLVDAVTLNANSEFANDTELLNLGVTPLSLSCPTLTGSDGTAYSSSFVATGGVPPYILFSYTGTLPPGLTLVGTTGVRRAHPLRRGLTPLRGR